MNKNDKQDLSLNVKIQDLNGLTLEEIECDFAELGRAIADAVKRISEERGDDDK